MPTSKLAKQLLPDSAARAILLCFFASGFSGLVYQVIWVRELVLVFGATTFAVSTVLTAFMGGLALGSFYFGRRSESIKRPLKLYAQLEIGIGIYGLAVPFIFAALPILYQPLWRWLHLSFFSLSVIRFFFAALVLMLPTALMGATLPVLSTYYARERERIGLHVGSLYALNTFGAVLGAAATGFVMIPALGMSRSTATAAAINLILGVIALRLSRRYEPKDERAASAVADTQPTATAMLPEGEPRERITASLNRRVQEAKRATAAAFAPSRLTTTMVLIAFALSGFVALSYEVIWSRILALIIGSSVYAFSIMLATFLIGLACGAALIARFVDRIGNHIVAFAGIEIAVGLTSLAGAYLFNDLPFAFVQLHQRFGSSSVSLLLLARFLIAAAVMIVPTLLLGALFPIVVKIVSSNAQTTGEAVGYAYSANTLGSIVGSFASGFVLIPTLGLLSSLKLCIAVNFVIAAALFVLHRQPAADPLRAAPRRKRAARRPALPPLRWSQLVGAAASLLLIVAVAVAELPWNSDVMSSAVYRYAPAMANFSKADFHNYIKQGQGETVFYREGITATVAVQKQGNGLVMKVNGKPEASTAGDMPTQILIGAMPLLLRQHTDNVLVIGLGSGVTVGAIEQFPVKRITCVELEPAVVEAAKEFNAHNNRALEDERLRLVSNDGRNYIYTTDEKFDVIVSEPSNPWVTGVANLFTLEYFKRGAEVLRDDGIFSQWLQLYEMSPADLRTLVATFRAAFPYTYIFRGAEGDLMLLGSKSERKIDMSILNAHLSNKLVARELARVNTERASDVISRFYLGPEEAAKFSALARINTDDNALIEFSAPRRVGTSEETIQQNLSDLLASSSSPLKYVINDNAPHTDPQLLVDAALDAVKRDDNKRAEQLVTNSLELRETAQSHCMLGELSLARGEEKKALEAWETALAIDPKHFHTLINLGKFYLTKQEIARAVPFLERAIQVDPKSARAHHLRGLAHQAANDHASAVVAYRKALPDGKYTHSQRTFYLNFGTALMMVAYYEEAVEMFEEYTRLAPEDFEGHYQMGVALEILSSRSLDAATTQRAAEALKRAIKLNFRHALSHYYLSRAYRRLERFDLADQEFEIYERLLP